jgi:acetylornithine/succinyldiaminopimelate/putrescine aminotransferase
MGEIIRQRAESLNKGVKAVRGKGLLLGIELDCKIPTSEFTAKCLDNGLLVVAASNQTIRLIPPLIINEDEIHEGMDIIEKVLNESI